MYYLRKINRGKWLVKNGEEFPQVSPNDVRADAITVDLKSSGDELSVWRSESDEDIDDIFVAIGSSGNHLDTATLIKIDETSFTGMTFNNDKGNTPAIRVNERHSNITNLTYETLGVVANIIVSSLKDEGNFIRCTKGKMRNLLKSAYDKGELDVNSMSKDILAKIV